MKKKWIKSVIALVVACGICAGGFFTYKYYSSKSASASQTYTYTPVKVTKGTLDTTVSASGTITCASQYDILLGSSGIVNYSNFKVGDKVNKGDLIAKIDDTNTQKSIQNYETSINQKDVELNQLQKSYDSNYIKSPASGRIKSLLLEAGDNASSISAAGPAAIISTDGKMKLTVDVPAGSDVNSVVTKNEKVNVTVNGETVEGVVSSTSVSRDSSSEKSIQTAESDISSKQDELKKLQDSLDNLYTTAPASGTIKSLSIQPGDNLSNITALGSVLTINRDGKMVGTINVEKGDGAGNAVKSGDYVDVYIGDTKIATALITSSTVQIVNNKTSLTYSGGKIEIQIDTDTYTPGTKVRVQNHDSSNVLGEGTIELSDPVKISSSSGIVSEVYVSENSVIKKGDNLFKLDEDSIKQNIENKKKEIQDAQDQLAITKATLGNYQQNKSATTGTGNGSMVVTISRDDFPVNATATVQKINGANTFIGTGELQINDPVKLTVGSGIIDKSYIYENSIVKKGDTLFKLNDDSINNSVASKNIEIQQAQLNLDNTKTILEKTSITSPIDGTIAAQNLKVGDEITSSQVGSKVAATVIDPNQMQVTVSIDELDINKIKLGQKANIYLDSTPDTTYEGQVSKISTYGKTTSGVTSYSVTVSIKSNDVLRIGMTANVKIVVSSKENVLLLPSTAIQYGSDNSKSVISETSTAANSNGKSASTDLTSMLKNNSKKITTGLINEQYAEILSGLEEGDSVLVASKVNVPKTTTTKSSTSNNDMNGGPPDGGMGGPPSGGGPGGPPN